MERKTSLILALDVTDEDYALQIAKTVADYVDAIKVNYPIILSLGTSIIGKISKYRPVIADLKIADIPYTSNLIAGLAFNAGAAGIIAHGFAGRDTIEAVAKTARRFDGDIFIVSELSSEGGKEFLNPVSDKIVKMAEEIGCSGIIAPATRTERISHFKKIAPKLRVVAPGVGAQGGDLEETLRAGADFVIIGRAIYDSDSPESAAKEYSEKIRQILKNI